MPSRTGRNAEARAPPDDRRASSSEPHRCSRTTDRRPKWLGNGGSFRGKMVQGLIVEGEISNLQRVRIDDEIVFASGAQVADSHVWQFDRDGGGNAGAATAQDVEVFDARTLQHVDQSPWFDR